MATKKILLGLTTTPGSDWRKKIEEISKFNIKEISLFPTFLDIESRRELYNLLENSIVKEISHVHLRNDMEIWELEYLMNTFKTHLFNVHPINDKYPREHDYSKFSKSIYIENVLGLSRNLPLVEEVESSAGLCIDFAHWQDTILKENANYNNELVKLLNKFKIGCCHISAAKNKKTDGSFETGIETYEKHWFDNLTNFDYIAKFKNYLPNIISLELENSFEEQLKVKEYLENIINHKI